MPEVRTKKPGIIPANVKDRISKSAASKPKGPLWGGPEKEGIGFSLLSRWLVCRDRFRVLAIDGLKPFEGWNHRLGYGNMVHVCEEARLSPDLTKQDWEKALKDYIQRLVDKHKDSQSDVAEVVKWYNVCKIEYAIYVEHWAKHPDMLKRENLLSEQVFGVDYKLPSGRVVKLKGKWDSLDVVTDERGQKSIWLQENKSPGEIDFGKLQQQLRFDCQTMLYSVALMQYVSQPATFTMSRPPKNPKTLEALANVVQAAVNHLVPWLKTAKEIPFAGVRYNICRRPLSGGEGGTQIKPREATQGAKCNLKSCRETPSNACEKCGGTGRVGAKPAETMDEYYGRLKEALTEKADTHFARWNVGLDQADIKIFRDVCLDPILENLCYWYDAMTLNDSRELQKRVDKYGLPPASWRTPYGLYNALHEGGMGDIDHYLLTGSTVGLTRPKTLFPELLPEFDD